MARSPLSERNLSLISRDLDQVERLKVSLYGSLAATGKGYVYMKERPDSQKREADPASLDHVFYRHMTPQVGSYSKVDGVLFAHVDLLFC